MVARDQFAQEIAVNRGVERQERRAEQVENVACGSVTPFSVPATLAV